MTGGTLGTLSGTGTSRTALFTPIAAQSLLASLSVSANTFTNSSGQNNLASNTLTLTGDTQRPMLEVNLSDSDLKAGDSATVNFWFSEAPSDFSLADVTAANGTLSGLTGTDARYSATLIPMANVQDATNVITVGTAWSDAAGNAPLTSTNSANYAVDTMIPTLDGTHSSPINGATRVAVSANLTLDFSENMVFGSAGTITLRHVTTGATVETFTVSGGHITGNVGGTATLSANTLTLNPHADLLANTPYSVQFSAGTLLDVAGNALAAISDDTSYRFTTAAAVAGVTLTQTGGTTAVTEGGATDSYSLVLDSQPTANVIISLSATNGQVTTDVSRLTFFTTNWNIPQSVTITAVDDTVVEGTHASAIRHVVTSPDSAYNGLAISNLVRASV